MMKFVLLFMTLSAFAAGEKIYQFGNLKIVFTTIDGHMVNRGCRDRPCEAFKKARESGKKTVPPELLVGGKNPFAVRCKTIMSGSVIIGVDDKGNADSFCRFADDSYLR